jgi:hypothetical protein
MPRFRSKAVIVEAQQWFPPGHPQHDPSMLTVVRLGETVPPGAIFQHGGDMKVTIRTPSGMATVNPGDWIITGPRTDIVDRYPCDPETFAAKYETEDAGVDLPNFENMSASQLRRMADVALTQGKLSALTFALLDGMAKSKEAGAKNDNPT